MKTSIRKVKGISAVRAKVVIDDDHRIIFDTRQPYFVLEFKIANQWFSQWMGWSCRGGRAHYYQAMIALYRKVRRAGLTKDSLHYLAGSLPT